MKKILTAILVGALLIMVFGQTCLAIQGNQEGSMVRNENTPDQIIQYVVYEAVFLDSNDVESVFEAIRGKLPPYEHVTQDYHVTTAFRPETDARALYGEEVEVRIIGYKAGEVAREDGVIVGCEGLKVELFSENEDMMNYLDNVGIAFHITGSYSDRAKYTGYMDFSDMEPMNVVLKGRFGAFLNGADYDSAFISFDGDQVNKVIEVP